MCGAFHRPEERNLQLQRIFVLMQSLSFKGAGLLTYQLDSLDVRNSIQLWSSSLSKHTVGGYSIGAQNLPKICGVKENSDEHTWNPGS